MTEDPFSLRPLLDIVGGILISLSIIAIPFIVIVLL